jgi:hypothetical protein
MVHNVLATRMILHLREVAEETLVMDSRHARVPTRGAIAGSGRGGGGRKEGVRDSPWYLASRPAVQELSGFVAAGNWGVRSVGGGSRGECMVD